MTSMEIQTSRCRIAAWVGDRRWLIAAAIAGALLRLTLIAALGSPRRFYDELDYEQLGTALSCGLGFKMDTYYTAWRPPGQPLFIGLIFAIVGHRVWCVTLVETLLVIILPFVCARIGRHLGLSPMAANLAATVVSLHPALAYASGTLYPTVLTTVALTIGILLSYEAVERDQTGRAVAAAAMLGLAGASTTVLAVLPALSAFVAFLRGKYRVGLTLVLVGMAPAMAWMIRNRAVLGVFSLGTNSGYNMALGANDRATAESGNWIEPDPIPIPYAAGEVALEDLDERLLARRCANDIAVAFFKDRLQREEVRGDVVDDEDARPAHVAFEAIRSARPNGDTTRILLLSVFAAARAGLGAVVDVVVTDLELAARVTARDPP